MNVLCRRKKKCVRVQSYIKGENETDEGPSNSSPMNNSSNNPINNNSKGNQDEHSKTNGRLVNSDGEGDDDLEDEDDDDQSPRDSRNGRESLESNSEQSVTSPAGFSSLPSLGSPASVASPSDQHNFESVSSIASVPSNASSWFSPPPPGAGSSTGAFKPPIPNPATFQSPHQQFHPGHSYSAYYGLMQPFLHNMQKVPVGTDPRDAKNPLSISQLTGNSVGEVHGAISAASTASHAIGSNAQASQLHCSSSSRVLA